MKKFLFFIFLSACSIDAKKKKEGLPPFVISEDDWATYEGRWVTNDNVIILELSLKSGADAYYQLTETFVSNKVAGGTPSKGTYSTYSGFGNNGLGIRLHGLSNYDKTYFRYDIAGNKQDEM